MNTNPRETNRFALFSLLAACVFLPGCGTITGLPSHGGGKRFAIEQELISASVRASAKSIDLSALKGRRVALYVNSIGDQGAGNLTGGQYSIDALLRGGYQAYPSSETHSTFPVVETQSVTAFDGGTTATTIGNALNSPDYSKTTQKGGESAAAVGVRYNGIGEYRNETLIQNPRDITFLTNILQSIFYLRGIEVVAPSQADVDCFISVDVFGTVRQRTDWHLFNREDLTAKTAFEIFATDRKTHEVVIRPSTTAFEAKYSEKYALWAGPYKTTKSVKKSDPLLVDFSDLDSPSETKVSSGFRFTEDDSEPAKLTQEEINRARGR